MKSAKYSKLHDVERKYEADGETEVGLKHTEEQNGRDCAHYGIQGQRQPILYEYGLQLQDSRLAKQPNVGDHPRTPRRVCTNQSDGGCRVVKGAREHPNEEKRQSLGAFLADHCH